MRSGDDTAYIVKYREMIWDAFKWKPTARMISPASGRLVFLGGDDLLRIESKVIDLWSGSLQGEVLDGIEHVASRSRCR